VFKNALIAFYILLVLAISAAARAGVFPNNATQGDELSDSSTQKLDFKTHVGSVLVLEDGSVVLSINQQNHFILRSQSDLTSYIGSKVMISGIELDQQSSLLYESDSKGPLPRINSQVDNLVTFFVLGISEVR
jgi:hypothetical protein